MMAGGGGGGAAGSAWVGALPPALTSARRSPEEAFGGAHWLASPQELGRVTWLVGVGWAVQGTEGDLRAGELVPLFPGPRVLQGSDTKSLGEGPGICPQCLPGTQHSARTQPVLCTCALWVPGSQLPKRPEDRRGNRLGGGDLPEVTPPSRHGTRTQGRASF